MLRINRILMLLLVLLALYPSATALAQGTSGTLPGPIDSRQLTRYADRLQLSEQQRLAMDEAHEDYLQQFRLLREGEIAQFLREAQAVQGGIPKRDVVEKLLGQTQRIISKIAVLDDGLFNQMTPLLTEDQQRMLPRVRLARERRRYEAQQTAASYGRRTADLSAIFYDLDLQPEEVAAADGIIAGYEHRMTAIMRKQFKAVIGMTLDMMDVLAENGYVDISQEELLKDPKLLQEVLGQIQEAYGTLREKAAEHTQDIRELNKQTNRQVAAVIPAAEARRLRNGFYRESYRELRSIVERSATNWMTRSTEVEDLTPEQRAVLKAAADEHQRKLSHLLNEGSETIDAFWDSFSPFTLNTDANEKLREDIESLRTRADDSTQLAETSVEQSLGESNVVDMRQAVAKLASKATEPQPVPAGANAAGPGEDEEDDVASSFAFITDRFLPDRISRLDIKRFTKQLQLEGDMSEVLDVIHRDYLERLSNLTVLEQLRDAREAARADADGDSGAANLEKIARVYDLRRQAIEAMAAADRAFFDDMGTIIGNESASLLERVRQTRLRQTYAGSASSRFALGRDSSNEASVDLVSIVLEEQPPPEILDGLGDIFTAYGQNAEGAIRARFGVQLEMQQLSDQWMAEIEEARDDDITAVIQLQNRYREIMAGPAERAREADRTLVQLNRTGFEQVLGRAGADLAARIRTSYDLAAFPSIFTDAGSVDDHLAAALKLTDLSPDRRQELAELSSTYQLEYDQLSRKMIEHLGAGSVNVVGLDPEAFKEWQGRQQQLARIRFDRNELNGRTANRLRATLSDEQLNRIGTLPEPPGEEDFYFYR